MDERQLESVARDSLRAPNPLMREKRRSFDVELSTAGLVARWLRLEGLAVLAGSITAYALYGRGWVFFVVLLFVPDLSIIGYLAGPRAGAMIYNVAHSYTVPVLMVTASLLGGGPLLGAVALVWLAHIGLDRMLGYGLKLPTGFHETHLGRIGRARRE